MSSPRAKFKLWLGRPRIYPALFFCLLSCYLLGLILFLSAGKLREAAYYVEYARFLPIIGGLIVLSAVLLVLITLERPAASGIGLLALLALLAILFVGVFVHVSLWGRQNAQGEDIYFVFLEGRRLSQGENPYERVLHGDMQTNLKYATYFPLAYLLSWASHLAGLEGLTVWLGVWRIFFLASMLWIAVLMYWSMARGTYTLFAIFAALFWLFNRWTLLVSDHYDIDFIPILLLLLSLMFFPQHKILSFALYGLSLGVKQFSIFLLPVYLIWAWQEGGQRPLKSVITGILSTAAVLVTVSLPFLIWNWKGFVLSILFSLTRLPNKYIDATSLDVKLGWQGVAGRLPLLLLIGLLYLLAWKVKPNRYLVAALVFLAFVDFNSVLFPSYFVWAIPFALMAAYALIEKSGKPVSQDLVD